MSALRGLGRPTMRGLASAIEGGRVAPPYNRSQLQGNVPDEVLEEVLGELRKLSGDGMAPAHIAQSLAVRPTHRAGQPNRSRGSDDVNGCILRNASSKRVSKLPMGNRPG